MQNVASWGVTLKDRRDALGLSPNRLGPHLGVSGETVRRWEKDLLPSADTMRRVDQVLSRLEAEQPKTLASQVELLQREIAQMRADFQSLSTAVQALAERLEQPTTPRVPRRH